MLEVRGHGQGLRLDGIRLPGIGLHDVVFAKSSISTGTAAGNDGIVGEIWKDIPWCLVIVVWILFRLRAEYGIGVVSGSWRIWELVGLPKIRSPTCFDEF
eukprot:1528223-Lingulodinium_polyedra.AAC.1